MAGTSTYSEERAIAICEQIATGHSLREIAAMEGMPCVSTIIKWLSDFPAFSTQYARARELQAEYLLEEIMEIADDGSNDYMLRQHGDNEAYEINGEHIQRSKLRVDARKWAMSKLAPKKYGDKVTNELTGANGGAIQTSMTVEFVKANERPAS